MPALALTLTILVSREIGVWELLTWPRLDDFWPKICKMIGRVKEAIQIKDTSKAFLKSRNLRNKFKI